ncbi:response regulator [Paenibacillus cymbidii]|uniref:response regulator n=1 Tax=Paenibacillus cymbidii TaxID=1639034 RepID=UPI001080DE6A|nr:response regulator [Paenibacillus cymbidii]
MKLLIVEDEHHVRERIAEGIDWPSFGIEVAHAVGSGREAWTIVQKERIDIVLTDIRMPEMGGLELAKHVKRDFPHVKIILLTGHDDFEYAREGIEHGVLKYLVKPADNDEIVAAVLEAKELREREAAERHSIALLERQWKEHLPHLKGLFYKSWLQGRYAGWEIERRAHDLQVACLGRKLLPVALDMDPIPEGNERFRVSDRALVLFALYTMARDVLESEACAVVQDDDGVTAAVFMAAPEESDETLHARMNHAIDELLATVRMVLRLTASAGIGPVAADAQQLPRAYRMSRMALQERIVLGNDMAIPYRDTNPEEAGWVLLADLEKELELAIETGGPAGRRELVQRIMEAGFATDKPLADAKELLLRMVCQLARIVHAKGWTLRETLKGDYEAFAGFGSLLAKEQIAAWLQRMADRIGDTIAERRKSGTQLTIGEVERFIQERLHEEELSLYLAAESMYVNYSYLSRTFKEVTGQSFSDYVLRLRMEKAKELLGQGMKVYDAAERVGYRHVNYFSKSFQKYWGIKPSGMFRQPAP